jgi:flagellar hook-associated protein 3 FlgL
MSLVRLGTANMYDRTINNISKQQSDLASQMEHTSAGKRVLRPGDDPVAAAQAERSRTRLSRIDSDQRGLDAQTTTIEYAEGTLGSIVDALQDFRELVVQAGNGAYDAQQRGALAQQLQSLRNQILGYANRSDSNGLPLFRGLDTYSSKPFSPPNSSIQAGQINGGEFSIANSLNGAYAFSSVNTGNGVLAMHLGSNNQGNVAPADIGTITDPSKASSLQPPDKVTIEFTVDINGDATYTVSGGSDDGQTGTYTPGQVLNIQGMELKITGTPTSGDSITIVPSEQQSIFKTLDDAITALYSADPNIPAIAERSLSYAVSRSLAEIDTGMDRVSSIRGVAGDMLNQAKRMGTTLLARNEQMESQRSAAEDIDMVAALSQLKTQETAVSAALQSYASIQKLSLFNYIN